MAADVRPLQPHRLPPGPSRITADQRYWNSFKSHQLIPSVSGLPVTHVSFSSSANTTSAPTTAADPNLIAVTSGPRIQLYTTKGSPYPKPLKTISTNLRDPTAASRSASLRHDSRILVAGSDTGALQVYDTASRAILKTWTHHKQATWCARWSPYKGEATRLMSTSDDRTVRLWDLTETDPLATFTAHQDYVRSGAWMPTRAGTPLLVSGSYDGTVRLWDTRASDGQVPNATRAAMTFAFKDPVETLLPLDTGSGTTLLTAAGNTIHVLDLVAARRVTTLKAHQKTVTSLCSASNSSRILTGALDGHVKIWDTTSWQVVAGRQYDSAVLSLTVVPAPKSTTSSPEDRHLLAGLSNGVLSIRTRLSGETKRRTRTREKEMAALAAGTIDSFDRKQERKRKLTQGLRARNRGKDYGGYGAELVIEGNERRGPRRKNLPEWDHLLRKLEYARALEAVLRLTPADANTVITVLRALVQRSALRVAVRGMQQAGSLGELVQWLRAHVADTRHIQLFSRVGMAAIEEWRSEVGRREGMGQRAPVDGGVVDVRKLHERVREQVENSHEAAKTLGMLDCLMVEGG